jgi:ribosomal protein L11 methyltransferase
MAKKVYIALYFDNISAEQSEMLIALLSDIGFTGFEEVNEGLKVFIDKTCFDAEAMKAVLKIVPVSYTSSEIMEENWNEGWESSFEPIIVNDLVAVRAAFHQPIPSVKHEIIITPKMSFGTGHHATTCLVIEQMLRIDITGKTLLDFGTGTGILSILAEKLGADAITAIDNDDWSIENAKENITANHCVRIRIEKAETISAGPSYDIILANINLNVIMANNKAITNAGKIGTILLLSGFYLPDKELLVDEMTRQGFTLLSIARQGDWIILCLKKIS